MIWVRQFGGYETRPGKFRHDCELPQGIYHVCPVSDEANPEHHRGYVAYFLHRFEGRKVNGMNCMVTYLGHSLLFKSAIDAKKACEVHYRETGQFLATSRREAFEKAAIEYFARNEA